MRQAEARCEGIHTFPLPARRLGECSGDIAETVINDVVERKG